MQIISMRPAWLGSFGDYYRLILAIGTFIADFVVNIAPVIVLVGIVKDNIFSAGDRMKGCSYPCMLLLDNGSRNISLNPLSYRWEIIVLSSDNTFKFCGGGKAQDFPICIAFPPERFQLYARSLVKCKAFK